MYDKNIGVATEF